MTIQKAVNRADKTRQQINYYKTANRLRPMPNLHSTWCPRCRGYLGDYVKGVKVRCGKCRKEIEVKKPITYEHYHNGSGKGGEVE